MKVALRETPSRRREALSRTPRGRALRLGLPSALLAGMLLSLGLPSAVADTTQIAATSTITATPNHSDDDESPDQGSSYSSGFYRTITPAQHSLTILAPLTVPPNISGLLTADELAGYTAPGTGLLSRHLDALAGHPITIGIDPMIIASIRVLGDAAPKSAVDWLARLALISNEIFPLSYADADLGYLAAVTEGALPKPTGFDFAFPAIEDDPDDATATSAAFVDPLNWDYDTEALLWPKPGTVSNGLLADSAGSTVLVSTIDLRGAVFAASARATIDGHEVLIADTATSGALSTAAGTAENSQRAPLLADLRAKVSSYLSSASTEGDTEERVDGSLVLAMARGTDYNATAIDGVFSSLDSVSGLRYESLSTLLAKPAADDPSTERALANTELDSKRIAEVRRVVTAETLIAREARAVTDSSLVTDDQRLRMLAVLSLAWPDETARTEALAAYETRADLLKNGVQLEPSSDVLVVSQHTDFPVTVSNAFGYPVVVQIKITSNSNRLLLGKPVEIEVAGESRKAAQVHLEAFANGPTVLNITATARDGTLIDPGQSVLLDIQAGWELATASVLGAGAVLLFVFGIVRSVLKRRRAVRSTPDANVDAPEAP